MAAGHTHTDVLSRVRREQRTHGKPSAFSGLRVVLFAAGITVAIMLFAFGALGMLMMARSPQEPIAVRLDPSPSPPPVQQTEVPVPAPQAEPETPTSIHEKIPEADQKLVKSLRVIAPPPQAPEQHDAVAQQQVPPPEPETTATIPAAPQAQPPQNQQRPARQQQSVRRPVPEQQYDNPLFQLFGIKKYR